jgi:hypothetical protein
MAVDFRARSPGIAKETITQSSRCALINTLWAASILTKMIMLGRNFGQTQDHAGWKTLMWMVSTAESKLQRVIK